MFGLGGAILRADLRGVVEEAFLQSELFIGPKCCPPIPVQTEAGQYPIIQKNAGNLLRNEAKPISAGGDYPRIMRAWVPGQYNCEEYGIEAVVPDKNARTIGRFFDLEARETVWAYRQVQIGHEIRVSNLLQAPATFSTFTGALSYTTTNIATFDVGLDVDSAKAQIQGRGENVDNLTLVMSYNNFLRIRGSTKLQNRIRGTVSTDTFITLGTEAMADALNVKQVLIGRATYDGSAQGSPASVLSNIWSDPLMWLGTIVEPSGPDQYFNGSVAFTIFWEQDADIFQVESYRQERLRSTIVRSRQNTAEQVVLAAGAQLIGTQYA
jgi:hypothetical protein